MIYKNSKFKISAPTWNDNFQLSDRSYSGSDIQDYIMHIIKKLGKADILTSETRKLIGSTKNENKR